MSWRGMVGPPRGAGEKRALRTSPRVALGDHFFVLARNGIPRFSRVFGRKRVYFCLGAQHARATADLSGGEVSEGESGREGGRAGRLESRGRTAGTIRTCRETVRRS